MNIGCEYNRERLASDLDEVIEAIRKNYPTRLLNQLIAKEIGISQETLRKARNNLYPREKKSRLTVGVVRVICEWLGVHPDRYLQGEIIEKSREKKWILRSKGCILTQ